MPLYLIYEVWTTHRVVEAANEREAYDKGAPPPPTNPNLNLCNWHIVRIPDADSTTEEKEKS